jgi:DNA-binding transcriptional ArsR family regulator
MASKKNITSLDAPISAKKAASSKKVASKNTTLKLTKSTKKKSGPLKTLPKSVNSANVDLMFEIAAETFRIMSAPMRLKIINCLCTEEKNVGQLLEEIDTTQPNMSQHLNSLFKAKILGRRREGVQIFYRIINEPVVALCRAVCTQIAIDSDIPHV